MTSFSIVNSDSTRRAEKPRLQRFPVRRIAALLADRRGASAVELALLLPVMTLMLAGVVQYGTLYYSYNSMLNTARNGARSLAIGTATTDQVIATAKANLPPWVPKDEWTITPSVVGTQVTTRITVPATHASIMHFAPMPETLDVNVVMVKEV